MNALWDLRSWGYNLMGLCYDLKGIDPNNIIYVLLDDARRNMWEKHICLSAFGSLNSNHSHFVFPIKNLISNVWYVYDTICDNHMYIYIYTYGLYIETCICSIHIILQLRSKSLQHLRIIPSLQFGFQDLIALSNDLWPSLTQKWVFPPRTLGC